MDNVVINPFQPGSPVPPGIFAGRYQQLNEISTCIYQTANFNPQNILITGERGIGKTSIAMVTKAIAEKQIVHPRYTDYKASSFFCFNLS